MLQQYFRIRAENPGALLAMRVGDFYEFYGEDAETAAGALEITLTGREDGGVRIPMAGVPYHSVEKYLARLVQQGFRVALCDQLEDPKQAKGLVKRGVSRVLTPGTLLEDAMLTAGTNNFLAAICALDGAIAMATLDPSTGEFSVTQVEGEQARERILQELARLRPAELLLEPDSDAFSDPARDALGAAVTEFQPPTAERAARKLETHFRVANLSGFGLTNQPAATVAAGMVIGYAEKAHLSLGHVAGISTYSVDDHMRLDLATRRSLELTSSMMDGDRKRSLLGVLDCTVTPMGARLLRKWVEQPLLDRASIEARHDAVDRLVDAPMVRGDLRDGMARLKDLERLTSRVAANLAGPRDLIALKESLQVLPDLAEPLRKVGLGRIQELREAMRDHRELALFLHGALHPEPPMTMREGGIIRPEFDLELDKLRSLSRNGKGYIAGLELQERERTGIGQLKVGFNSVFGYFLEVPKSQISKVPEHYIRKQTTAGAERYITAELKDHESLVLGAEEKANQLESELFLKVRARVAEQSAGILSTARALSEVDALGALAETAVRRQYRRPTIREDDALIVRGGRHPVVEASSLMFVPNDADLGEATRLVVLTGPNMSGKSTYLRQLALIVVMAQIGSFVPAEHAEIGLCDRVFARIGAKDELALGQSTFMVEMVESANILNHATDRSLVILDEVGRGTSTYDGLAIAWAMIEYLAAVRAKTLFATHYHQLNALAASLPGVANYCVSVEEVGDEVIWTHRVVPGGTDRSYGIQVARMAGVPPEVLTRAKEVLDGLERTDPAVESRQPSLQLQLFEVEEPEVVQRLRELDVNGMTPVQALQFLDDWKKKLGAKR